MKLHQIVNESAGMTIEIDDHHSLDIKNLANTGKDGDCSNMVYEPFIVDGYFGDEQIKFSTTCLVHLDYCFEDNSFPYTYGSQNSNHEDKSFETNIVAVNIVNITFDGNPTPPQELISAFGNKQNISNALDTEIEKYIKSNLQDYFNDACASYFKD